ncbi:hypothetical protein D3C81_1470350 [compost metagenome]
MPLFHIRLAICFGSDGKIHGRTREHIIKLVNLLHSIAAVLHFGNGDYFRILPGIFLCGQAQVFDHIQIGAVIKKLDVHWQINHFVR